MVLVIDVTRYNVGDIITGKVTGIKDYGIFVSFGDNCSGLIHISEISLYYVNDISEYAKIGDIIEAKILNIDTEGKYKLSIKDENEKRTYKKKKNKIVETKSGFTTLRSKLGQWIEKYLFKKS